MLPFAAGGWILVENLSRLKDPEPVNGARLAAIATVGLVVGLGSAVLVHRAEGDSLNMRASFVHLATDAAGSLAAAVAGLLILAFGWVRADALASAAIAALVLWAGWRLLRDATHVLMEGTPRGLDTDQVRAEILDDDGVTEVHHLHLWHHASDIPTLSPHVMVPGDPGLRDPQGVVDNARTMLAEKFALHHTTLEIECSAPGADLREAFGDQGEPPRCPRRSRVSSPASVSTSSGYVPRARIDASQY